MPSGYFGGFAICGLFTCGRGRGGAGVAERTFSLPRGVVRGSEAASETTGDFE